MVVEGRDSIVQQGNGEEDQEDLLICVFKNIVVICVFEYIDVSDKEEGSFEVYSQSDCDLIDEKQLFIDLVGNMMLFGGCKYESLVVDIYMICMINMRIFFMVYWGRMVC